MYQVCDGRLDANQNASVIEGVTSITITTTIKVKSGVIDPANKILRKV